MPARLPRTARATLAAVLVSASAVSACEPGTCDALQQALDEDAEGVSLRQLRAQQTTALKQAEALELQVEQVDVVHDLRMIVGSSDAVNRLRSEVVALIADSNGELDCSRVTSLPPLRLMTAGGRFMELRPDEYMLETEHGCVVAAAADASGRWLVGDFGRSSDAALLQQPPSGFSPPPGFSKFGFPFNWTSWKDKAADAANKFKGMWNSTEHEVGKWNFKQAWDDIMNKFRSSPASQAMAAQMAVRCSSCVQDISTGTGGCASACSKTGFANICTSACTSIEQNLCKTGDNFQSCAADTCKKLMMCQP